MFIYGAQEKGVWLLLCFDLRAWIRYALAQQDVPFYNESDFKYVHLIMQMYKMIEMLLKGGHFCLIAHTPKNSSGQISPFL